MTLLKLKDKHMQIFFVIGIILMTLAQAAAIGHGLYLWGAEEMALGHSAWEAFKVWGAMMIVGVVTFLLGITNI